MAVDGDGAPVGGDGDGDGDGDGIADVVLDVCATGDADYTTIGAAVDAAPDGAVLAVCPGTYHERLKIVDKPLSIHGVGGAEVTILDAEGGGVALAVEGTTGAGLRIDGLTIRGGASSGAGGGIRCEASGLHLIDDIIRDNQASGGGGLYVIDCELEVTGSTFAGNDGDQRGGGAFLVRASGEIKDSAFLANQATNGGGIHVRDGSVVLRNNELRENAAALRGGGLYHDSDALVEDNAIVDNTAGWTGGGVHISEHAPVLRGNLVRRNTSMNDGGGIYVHQSTGTIIDGEISGNEGGDDGGGLRLFESRARIEGNLISDNVTAGDGGGIRVSHQPCLFVDNIIRDNEASGGGGGIDMDNDSSVVRGGLIANNRAARGGGIHATLFPWRDAAFEGIRIAGNTATDGGGIHLEDNFYPIAVRDLEIVDNTATRSGGGLFIRSTNVTIRNTMIASNQADDDGGGLYVGQAEPWPTPTECPCPPTSPSFDVDFVVLHANEAASGAAVWVDVDGLSIANSILSGHSGNAVAVLGAAPAWSYNDAMPASFSGMTDPTGSSGNISADPQYANDAFALAGGSPCRNAGDPATEDRDGTRADMGRNGGPEAP